VSVRHKPCAKPGCPNIHTEKGMYCKEHKRGHTREYTSPYRHMYNAEWQRESKRWLRGHPWCECEDCKAGEYRLPANCVDHHTAHKGDAVLFWDRRNWVAMNTRCNARKSTTEGGFGR